MSLAPRSTEAPLCESVICFAAHEVARIKFPIDVHQYNQEPMNRYR